MLLKLTTKCNMGCTHCMNDATEKGVDMSIDTLKDTLLFMKKTDIGAFLVISGGEPMNHPQFFEMIKIILEDYEERFKEILYQVTITTNGEFMNKPENVNKICNLLDIYSGLNIQICNDPLYYPRKVELNKAYKKSGQVMFMDNIGKKLYPKGRALKLLKGDKINKNKCTQCTNYRLLYKQLGGFSLSVIDTAMILSGKFCTPAITPKGDILLGESDLCKVCSNIYKSEKEILKDIGNFHCNGCKEIYDSMDRKAKDILEK